MSNASVILIGTDFQYKSELAKILEEAGFEVFATFYAESVLERLRVDAQVSWVVVLDDQACDPESLARVLRDLHQGRARLIRAYPNSRFPFSLPGLIRREFELGTGWGGTEKQKIDGSGTNFAGPT